jgi:hypothetical protein
MRALLATALILGGVLLLGACTKVEEAEEPTGTPAATTPAGTAARSTPSDLVQRPRLASPTATAAPTQTVAPQPTEVSQPTVVPQLTEVSQPTEAPQPTVVPQPTEVPPTAPPPTIVLTVVPTPVPTPKPTPIATPTPAPTPTGPVVFRGQVVDGPWKQEPVFGPCDWWWWSVQVEVDEVIKMEQTDGGCGLYSYASGETIEVLYFANDAPAVAPGAHVEVSGEESMFSCGCTCCCDGCGFIVDPGVVGSYLRRL